MSIVLVTLFLHLLLKCSAEITLTARLSAYTLKPVLGGHPWVNYCSMHIKKKTLGMVR